MATALFTISFNRNQPHLWAIPVSTRIASNIVQGIGFWAPARSLKDSAGLVGMTTAATIFAEAAIGMAAGAGLYAVAGSATAIVLFGLFVVAWCADRFNLKSRPLVFRFTTSPRGKCRHRKFSACLPA